MSPAQLRGDLPNRLPEPSHGSAAGHHALPASRLGQVHRSIPARRQSCRTRPSDELHVVGKHHSARGYRHKLPQGRDAQTVRAPRKAAVQTASKPARSSPFSDATAMIEGIIYRYLRGIAWRDVPAVFGPWQTIWTWHRRLASDGS
ncbi:transposase [Rhodococcus sp. C26F]